MNLNNKVVFVLLLVFPVLISVAQRNEIPFNHDWQFNGSSVTGEKILETVNIPHTWNAWDAQEGIPYFRGEGTYIKSFIPEENWRNQRLFIRFEGVMTMAKVYLNEDLLGEHRGGYSAFIFELTNKVRYGEENVIKVVANNEYTLEVLPLFGDFNIYGGMYRPVSLILTPQVCISPLDYASPGIYLKQKQVTETLAEIEAEVLISNAANQSESVTVVATVFDADGSRVKSTQSEVAADPGETRLNQNITLENPRLWNGKRDAHLYQVKIDILQDGKVIDSKTEPLGIRYFKVDSNEGFFLNGKHMPLNGVSRHQDRKNKGNALCYSDHKQDMEIMLEMGINALRLAHYQHSETIYDLADSSGIVVWAELPWVGGPGSLMGGSNGYEPTEAFHNNARQQLRELIRQNFNHPSICFWSIFNEIQNPEEQSPVEFIHELNELAKTEDPSRITVGASMLDPKENIHDITDAIAWNRYFGWYYAEPKDMGDFLDEIHENNPTWCIGISEYGAGASIIQHSQKLKKPNPFGSPHPEQWQSFYAEEHLKIFIQRPFVWGTFYWNMFDFGSQFRREGDHYGINDKGLVTFDRKTKKDAFYFFKANWSEEPVLYITSRRHIFRDDEKTKVKVYSNLNDVTLSVNGANMGTKSPVDGIIVWEDINLEKGNNGIVVSAKSIGREFTDSCVWVIEGFGTKEVAKIYDLMNFIPHAIIIGLLLLTWLWFKGWRKKEQTAKWKRITARIFFFIVIAFEVLLIAFKILISSAMG